MHFEIKVYLQVCHRNCSLEKHYYSHTLQHTGRPFGRYLRQLLCKQPVYETWVLSNSHTGMWDRLARIPAAGMWNMKYLVLHTGRPVYEVPLYYVWVSSKLVLGKNLRCLLEACPNWGNNRRSYFLIWFCVYFTSNFKHFHNKLNSTFLRYEYIAHLKLRICQYIYIYFFFWIC